MNEKKIDLILEGVNLLVMNSELNIEFKTAFNKSFRECFEEKTKEEDCCEMPEREGIAFLGKNPGQREEFVKSKQEVKE